MSTKLNQAFTTTLTTEWLLCPVHLVTPDNVEELISQEDKGI
ncbi:hypothetical protein O9992_27640 [Vibrio lentus]|nr:hypothetical protein [Vibrio lentus]